MPPYFHTDRREGYCFSACIAMILGYYGMPINPYDEGNLIELDMLTGYDPVGSRGAGTMPYRVMFELSQRGFDVKLIDPFDNKEFADDGYEYFKSTYLEFYERMPAEDYVQAHAEAARGLLEINPEAFEKKVPTLGDLLSLLRTGYLVICSVDCQKLQDFIRQALGYNPPPVSTALRHHSALTYMVEDEDLILHDPFYPRNKAIKIPTKLFDEEVWVSPSRDWRFMTAFRLTSRGEERLT